MISIAISLILAGAALGVFVMAVLQRHGRRAIAATREESFRHGYDHGYAAALGVAAAIEAQERKRS